MYEKLFLIQNHLKQNSKIVNFSLKNCNWKPQSVLCLYKNKASRYFDESRKLVFVFLIHKKCRNLCQKGNRSLPNEIRNLIVKILFKTFFINNKYKI